MYNKTNLLQAAKSRVASSRENAVITAYNHKQEVYTAVPSLVELDNNIINCGIKLSQLAAGNADHDILQQKKEELNAYEEKRLQLICDAGFDANYILPQFSCPMCKDTGRLNGQVCKCVTELVRRMRRDEINASSPLLLSSFDTFSLNKYSADIDAALGASPRSIMAEILEYCKNYANNFNKKCSSLFLMGDAGLGKTHLALSIANCVLDKGFDVIYVSSQNIFAKLEQEHFEGGSTQKALIETDLLVLDDLGTEYITPYILSVIYDLVNTRMLTGRQTIYTTNITTQQLLNTRYTEKVASRLLGSCEILQFFGNDIRLQGK